MTEIWTVASVLDATREYLRARGVESARLEAELLLGHVLACERLQLLLQRDMPLDETVRARLRDLVRRRGAGEPTAYLLGTREFYGITFAVDRRCLIPRPETEHLVDEALLWLREERRGSWRSEGRPPRVLEVGTGSGCIAVSLARNFEDIHVFATDSSSEALELARSNVANLEPDAAIQLLEGDLASPAKGAAPFDLVVSNPPYIARGEMADLPASVRDHEPLAALCPGDDPLVACRQIVREALPLLAAGGAIMLEIPDGGARPMKSWIQHEYPGRGTVRTVPDLAGIDRVLIFQSDDRERRQVDVGIV